jgi:hypothetical protein
MFKYSGDAYVFIALGRNDAPLPDTNNQPMTSGMATDRSFTVPLLNRHILVSGKGVSILPDTINIEASPRYSNDALKPFAFSMFHISSC